jgi:uncharacterized protein YdhG (YjbR/CyaY superfamily)
MPRSPNKTNLSKSKPTTVTEYILSAPKESRKMLRELRALLKKVAPKATEALKWGSPVLEDKRILFSYSAFRSHINFMPTNSSLEPFRKELAGYKTGKDTLQLPYDKPLPKSLLRRIAAYRVRDVKNNNALWMSSRK